MDPIDDNPIPEEMLGIAAPGGAKIDKEFVELILRHVSAGTELLKVSCDPVVSAAYNRAGNLAELWAMHGKATKLIEREFERRKLRAEAREKSIREQNRLLGGGSVGPVPQDDDEHYDDAY